MKHLHSLIDEANLLIRKKQLIRYTKHIYLLHLPSVYQLTLEALVARKYPPLVALALVTHTTAPRGLQRGHGEVVGMGQLGMSRRGDCPLVELEYMVLSSVKHTPTFDVTANSRQESLLATSALNPVIL